MASTSYQVCEHAPQVFFKSQAPKRGRVLQDHFQQGATPLCFSILYGTFVLAKSQGRREILSEAWNKFFGGGHAHAPRDSTPPPSDVRSALEKMRDTVAEFDEDYKGMGERILGFFMQLVGHVGPFALMIFVGADLGKYFSAVMGDFSAYGVAFTLEGIIASATVAMGRAFEEIASGKATWNKAVLIVVCWLLLNLSSAFGLYLIISGGKTLTGIALIGMVVRVAAIALGDLACSAVLMFRGRSLQKHIESIKKRASSITELSDAQRAIEEADKNAKLREQQLQATLKIQEDLSAKIGDAVSMVMESILSKMEKALKDDSTKNDKTYGRR